MKQEEHISSFDEWVRQSVEHARIEPPAGVWESVQSATSAGAGTGSATGLNVVQKITRFILEQAGWKAALGVAGILGAGYLVTELIETPQPKEPTSVQNEQPLTSVMPEKAGESNPLETSTPVVNSDNINKPSVEAGSDIRNNVPETGKTTQKSRNLLPLVNEPALEKQNFSASGATVDSRSIVPEFSEEKEIHCKYTQYALKSAEGKAMNWYVNGQFKSKGESLELDVVKNQSIRVQAKDALGRMTVERTYVHQPAQGIEVQSEYLGENTYRFKAKTPPYEMLVWNLGEEDEPVFNQKEIIHTFRKREQTYQVALVFVSENDCADTVVTEIWAKDADVFKAPLIPNIFTPYAEDGLNDEFRIEIETPDYFHVVVKDLRGQVVFESMDATQGWNGRFQNSGEMCPRGKYYYTLVYKMKGGTTQSRQNVLLLN